MKKTSTTKKIAGTIGLTTLAGIIGCFPPESDLKKNYQDKIITEPAMTKSMQITDVREATISDDGFPIQIVVAKDPEGEKGFINIGINANLHRGAATITYKKLKEECTNAYALIEAFINPYQNYQLLESTKVCGEGIIEKIEYE
ncbi:hypothetical protein HY643_02020 [Candidatus Woesearchaeota archaeon]|nr:hypothetical protein [Candidatus Woesearchaeota archaeon]